MGFSNQQHWNRLPFSSPGYLPKSGIKLASLASPALAGGFFTTWEAQSAPLPILITSSYYIRYLNNVASDFNLSGDFAFSVKNQKQKYLRIKRNIWEWWFKKKKNEYANIFAQGSSLSLNQKACNQTWQQIFKTSIISGVTQGNLSSCISIHVMEMCLYEGWTQKRGNSFHFS